MIWLVIRTGPQGRPNVESIETIPTAIALQSRRCDNSEPQRQGTSPREEEDLPPIPLPARCPWSCCIQGVRAYRGALVGTIRGC